MHSTPSPHHAGQFRPQTLKVQWREQGTLRTRELLFPIDVVFPTEADADRAGITLAMAWIDREVGGPTTPADSQ